MITLIITGMFALGARSRIVGTAQGLIYSTLLHCGLKAGMAFWSAAIFAAFLMACVANVKAYNHITKG